MAFPYYFRVGPLTVHPHFLFESLAYFVGFRIFLRLRRGAEHLGDSVRWSVLAAAIVGALAGSKLLAWAEDPQPGWQFFFGGKTIVGGLLGGMIAVEWVKYRLGVRRSTGDLYAIPLAVGIAIGRIGCFLSGLTDATHGLPTSLPWGVDLGDGIPRHPVQIYEMMFLLALAAWLWRLSKRPHRNGQLFSTFMIAYLAFRLVEDSLKPTIHFGGLCAIQWACLAGLAYYVSGIPQRLNKEDSCPVASVPISSMTSL